MGSGVGPCQAEGPVGWYQAEGPEAGTEEERPGAGVVMEVKSWQCLSIRLRSKELKAIRKAMETKKN